MGCTLIAPAIDWYTSWWLRRSRGSFPSWRRSSFKRISPVGTRYNRIIAHYRDVKGARCRDRKLFRSQAVVQVVSISHLHYFVPFWVSLFYTRGLYRSMIGNGLLVDSVGISDSRAVQRTRCASAIASHGIRLSGLTILAAVEEMMRSRSITMLLEASCRD